jgi:hypothetical protein
MEFTHQVLAIFNPTDPVTGRGRATAVPKGHAPAVRVEANRRHPDIPAMPQG